ncbi:MAG: hypothetical protein PHI18_06290 [bacterium]|nr:hypothetical protein [bacterium]
MPTVTSKRIDTDQSLHDKVIDFIAKTLDRAKYDIYTNPGQEKNTHIGGQFPDVILTPKGDKSVQFVIEVETKATVTEDEARGQWKEYAGLPGTFYLIVPEGSLELARILCSAMGIKVKLGSYAVDSNNHVSGVNYL